MKKLFFVVKFMIGLLWMMLSNAIDFVHIRSATLNDIPAIAAIQLTCLKTVFQGLVAQEYLDSLTLENREHVLNNIFTHHDANAVRLVAVDKDDMLIGFAIAGIARDHAITYEAELYAIYILPCYHRQKIGTRLLQHIASSLLQKNIHRLYLWTIEQNPACTFYEKMQAQLQPARQQASFGNAQLVERMYSWDDLDRLARLTDELLNNKKGK